MKKRSVILSSVSFVIMVGILISVFLIIDFQNHNQPEYYPVENKIRKEQIKTGNLDNKYLTKSELRILTLDVDSNHVKYLKGLDLSKWLLACKRGIDCIPSITAPSFKSVQEVDWLGEWSLIIGVYYKGVAKAYPLRIMNWHHIVNDKIKDTSVIVTFSPLTATALVFEAPTINDSLLKFGVSGRLYNANMLIYDRKTGSLWQQFEGKPIAGPLLGRVGTLRQVPADVVPWKLWKEKYPHTQVLSRESVAKTPLQTIRYNPNKYDKQPYAEYQLRRQVGYGVIVSELLLKGIPPKKKVVGIRVSGASKAYLEEDIMDKKLLNDELGGIPILVIVTPAGEIKFYKRRISESGEILQFELGKERLVDKNTGTEWSLYGEALSGEYASEGNLQLEEIPSTPTYWFAWLLFNSHTKLFTALRSLYE